VEKLLLSIYEVCAVTGREAVSCSRLELYPDRLDGRAAVWHFADYVQIRWMPATRQIPFARMIFLTGAEAEAGVKVILSPFLPEEGQLLFPAGDYALDAINLYTRELFEEVRAAFEAFTGQKPATVLQ